MYIKLKEMEIIDAVSYTKNISQAANEMKMQQANVSKYISDFEKRIGLKIFDRTSRSISLTDFGEILLPYVKKQLESKSEIIELISDYKKNKAGLVTIYAPADIMRLLSREVIKKINDIESITLLFKTYNINTEIHDNKSVFPDDCDILLSHMQPKDENLVSTRVFSYSMGLYSSPEYKKKKYDWHEHNLISTHSLKTLNNSVDCDINKLNLIEKYICDNSNVANELALYGLGILLSTRYNVHDELESGTLIDYLDGTTVRNLDVFAIFKVRSYQPIRIQYVLEKLLHELRYFSKSTERKI